MKLTQEDLEKMVRQNEPRRSESGGQKSGSPFHDLERESAIRELAKQRYDFKRQIDALKAKENTDAEREAVGEAAVLQWRLNKVEIELAGLMQEGSRPSFP